uniref:Uncharacterized protein n=1 Tax=Tetradesmus obliquus TaxID=3088 RepID=A0A383VVQ1_TETOB|eukprot:jgi/Sobl393_1/3422/SZX68943.1
MMLTARPAATGRAAAGRAASHSSSRSSAAAAGTCALPRPHHATPTTGSSSSAASAMQRKSSMDTGMQRQFSGSCSIGLSRRASAAPPQALGTVAEAAEAAAGNSKLLGMLTDPGVSSASFDDVCEVLGDVAKLDSVSAALNPSALGAGQAALKTLTFSLFGSNAAVSWGLEKVTQNLHNLLGFSLLEGLIDKSLIDLFQQMYGVLDLSGDIGSIPALRLGVAAAVALVVRQLVVKYQQEHPAKLERQLSPAASLTDAIAEAAAAALIAESVQPAQQQQLQLQPAFSMATASGSSSSSSSAFSSSAFACYTAAATTTAASFKASTPSFQDLSSSLLQQEGLSHSEKARLAARSAFVSLLLGQFKRANKLKRKFRSSANEALQGRLSPALLLALIEAGVLVHNYSELSNGVSALLGLAS